ncbi:hypothetical protein PIB30_010537 [Stylosanthes scabra]|uniref:SWIM-type domain-containing protein n=1 Tax=Stylosanthes scabra TaxID=79078 RepID=A0ABU6R6H5_9FABA|nr:hypothetical protein [Stylosanthes scabra]
MSKIVWSSLSKEKFEEDRGSFIRKNGLCGNKWLSGSKEQKEKEAGVGDCHTTLPCVTNSVEEEISVGRSTIFDVTYDSFEEKLKCDCLLFESRGIVCRYSLVLLNYERVDYISSIYILERWCKNNLVNRRHLSIKSSFDQPLMLSRAKIHCEVASRCPLLTSIVNRGYDKIEDEIKEYKEKKNGDVTITHENGTIFGMNDLQNPSRVRARGRPKKRLGSMLEKLIASTMKKRKDVGMK